MGGDKALIERMMALTKPGGRCSSTATVLDPEAEAARGLTVANVTDDAAARIGEMITSGYLIPPAVRAHAFDDVAAALADQASRHVCGKVVLSIGD